MSWLSNVTGEPKKPYKVAKDEPRIADASGRLVVDKSANRPFLAHKEWREQEAARKKAKEERKKERLEKIARGEEVGPEEPEDDEEVGLIGLLKFIVYVLLFILLASKFVTGSWIWEYDGKWTNIKSYIPADQRVFSPKMLAQFDGTDPDRPIYIAIDGVVYDVTAGAKTYGKGGSYNTMAGVDATRSYGTGCFRDHRTHDLRGLTERELNGIQHWIDFFKNSNKYFKVGTVRLPPIDPNSEIPKDCRAPKDEPEPEPQPAVGPKGKHNEL
ncbi:cytochrome b5 [Sistotremastrum suecicum HHB10207 ss-3]|uniref:Cytochrome b5 n=1 Tax=Sistotremastrum suecicum HHB10207 ss-3 TaxID=1314776 RepID=A0A166FYF2_9AGAM|nr:cytochrome b5 [Sistotremastrum suecicum HHB10207 ss-3]